VSGLKVNFFKSRFGTIGVATEDIMRYANLLNCKILSSLFTYLGIPIDTNPKLVEIWKLVLQKFSKK